MGALRYASAAVRDFRVGAVTASTKYVVRAVSSRLDRRHRFVVEYGAGDGTLSRSLLKRLPENGCLTAVELNQELYAELKTIGDPRLRPIRGDALLLSRDPPSFQLPRVDAVVSSIPLTFFPPEERKELVRNTHAVLASGGIFVVFQYTPLVLPLLRERFRDVTVGFEPRNVLPYFIMRAQK